MALKTAAISFSFFSVCLLHYIGSCMGVEALLVFSTIAAIYLACRGTQEIVIKLFNK
jgi:hypothetical protein